jgi:hypothetical protein
MVQYSPEARGSQTARWLFFYVSVVSLSLFSLDERSCPVEKRFVLPLSLVLFASVLSFFDSCHRATEEDKVRNVITGVEQAAEQKNIMSMLKHISTAYHDPKGNDYDAVKGLLAYYFIRHEKVGIFIPSIEVAVKGQTARAEFQAILTGGGGDEEQPGSLLPDDLGAYAFIVEFAKEKGAWKVTSATWRRSGEGRALSEGQRKSGRSRPVVSGDGLVVTSYQDGSSTQGGLWA